MLFFKRILDFKQATLANLRNKRKVPRYVVGPGFPLRGVISLIGTDSAAKAAAAPPGSGCEWSGPLADLSSCGARLLLPPAAMSVRGEKSTLRLTIGQYSLQLPCVVIHFRALSSHSICGLGLEFTDFTAQKAFMQLHEAVRLGASFVSVRPSALQRPPPGLIIEQFEAGKPARLTVWREAASRQIHSFELVLDDHCLRGEAEGPTLEVYAREGARDSKKAARSASAYKLSAGLSTEVRQFFRWVVPNLGKAVPADTRAFMQRVIGDTLTGAERDLARSFPPPPLMPSRSPVPVTPPPHLNFGKPGPKPRPAAKDPG